MENIGSKFRAARLRSGMTQKQVAEKMGCTLQNINRIESGRHNIKYETMVRLSRAIGVPVNDIWSDDEQNTALLPETEKQLQALAATGQKISDALEETIIDLFRQLTARGKGDALVAVARIVDAESWQRSHPTESKEKDIKSLLSL